MASGSVSCYLVKPFWVLVFFVGLFCLGIFLTTRIKHKVGHKAYRQMPRANLHVWIQGMKDAEWVNASHKIFKTFQCEASSMQYSLFLSLFFKSDHKANFPSNLYSKVPILKAHWNLLQGICTHIGQRAWPFGPAVASSRDWEEIRSSFQLSPCLITGCWSVCHTK